MDKTQPCNSQSIESNIEAAMEAAGESVHSLAKKTGIAYTTLDRRMKDGLSFKLGELAKLADALEVAPEQLLSPHMFSNQPAN